MQLSQAPTKILQAASPGRNLHVFVSDITGLYFYVFITWFTHTPNIEVLCSNKGFDVEISSSNTPSRELYRIILIDSNEKKNMMVATIRRNM